MFDLRIVSLSIAVHLGCFVALASADDQKPEQGPQAEAPQRAAGGAGPEGVLGKQETPANEATSDHMTKVQGQWRKVGWPMIEQFCLDCHNADYQEAEVDLSGYKTLDQNDMQFGDGAMQRVLEMVRFGAMPPEDAEQPTPQQRKALVDALDQTLFAVSCDLRPRPGKVTARRLNRAEYNHTIRDLFGMDLRPADAFPSDEVGAGFDNNGDVLTLSPMQIEKYLEAAESVATQVVIDPETLPSVDKDVPSDQLLVHGEARTGSFYGRFLAPEAFVWADFEVPVAGRYRLEIRAGNTEEDREKTTLAIYDQRGLLRGTAEVEYFGGGGSSRHVHIELELDAGKHRFYVEPLEEQRELETGKSRSEFFANLDSEIIDAAHQRKKEGLKPDRSFDRDKFAVMVRGMELEGPRPIPEHLFPPSQHEIVRRHAKRRGDGWTGVSEAAHESLKPLMRRAFREPVTDEEVEPYAKLVTEATQRGESYYRGLQIAVSAILVSPRFLFRVETPPEDWPREDDGSVRLTPYQLATRLSYFLWSSTPDEALLQAAEKGTLSDPKVLEQQVRRMIADPKADSLADQFAAQWLGLRNLDVHEADTEKFGDFTPSLRQAMAEETELLFLHALRENLPVADLLTTDYTFVNEELARYYGLKGVAGKEFQKVSLKQTPRRGVLSHASVLTLTSNPGRTSPVKRGKWILQNVLGTPPPDPPAGVPELEETKTASESASLREQLELHRASPTCASCHRVMDQLGFGLEQFNAVGRYREKEGSNEVDASGELPGGRFFNGARELSQMLGETESEAFARTATHRLLTFALGRELTPTDRCVVDEIISKTSKQDHRLVDLILEVVKSRPFQYYDGVDKYQSTEESNS